MRVASITPARAMRSSVPARPDQLGTRDRWRLLLLAQANAFTGVLTGAGDTLDLRHAALRRGGHTRTGGGVLHLTPEALGYLFRRARRWYGENGDCGPAAIATANPPARISRRTGL